MDKGHEAINKYQSQGIKIPPVWKDKLNQLIYEYKITTIVELLEEINQKHPPALFDWLKDNNKSLYNKHTEIESKLNDLIRDNNQDISEFEETVEKFKQWFLEVIYKYNINIKSNKYP